MNLVRRKGQVVYEDLLRELEVIERQLMTENSGLAMSVMVLEAKFPDRFHQMEMQRQSSNEDFLLRDTMSVADLEALIPRDIPTFPEAPSFTASARSKTWETVGMAGVLAV